MKIANIDFGNRPLFLAPMEDVTDRSFRRICKNFGADMLYTEFVASEAIIRNISKSLKKLNIEENERPVGIQIYGHNIDAMVESAKIAEAYCPELIDINFGCPVRKIATRGAGAGMLQDIPKLIKMTSEIVKAVKIPVTVKTRLGWDSDNLVIERLAEQLQDVGIHALTIHGRTRAQLYKGVSDWTLIGNIKNNPKICIPIIGNGDVTNAQIAKQNFDNYNVDAIMIGRATIGRPWIFREIKHFLNTGEILQEPTLIEKVQIAKQHLEESIFYKENKRGVFEMRKHFALYFKALPDFKPYRLKLLTSEDVTEINSILDEISNVYAEY